MSSQSRRVALVAVLLATAALFVWVPSLIDRELSAERAGGDYYMYVTDTYGYSQTSDQSVVASPYDLRLHGSLSDFPRRLGNWQGLEDIGGDGTDALGFSTHQHVFRQYRSDQGRTLWLRLLATSDWKLFYHTPFVCYQSNGWQMEPESTYVVPVGESSLPMRGFVAQQDSTRHLVVYTFLWPNRHRDMSEGATMLEIVVPFEEASDRAWGDALDFARLVFADSPALVDQGSLSIPRRVDADLGGQVTLLGYGLSSQTVKPGDKLRITLYWKATGDMTEDYTVFVHAVNPPGGDPARRVLAQVDRQPFDGMYPTSRWRVGQVIKEVYVLDIPTDAAAGNRELEVGMYLLSTQRRLDVLNAAGQPQGDAVALSPVTIQP